MDSGFTAILSTHASRMIHVVPDSSLIVSPNSGSLNINPSHISLNWLSQTSADSYHVLVAADPTFKNTIIDQTTSSSVITVDNLKPDTHYYWKVSTILGSNETQLGIYSFHTQMTTVPAAPDWVLAYRKDNDSVSLTWNPTFGTESYTVYRKEINIFGVSSNWSVLASNLTAPTFVDKTAKHQNGVKYSYFITAKNKIGESVKSPKAETDDQTSAQVIASLVLLLSIVILVIIFTIARSKNKSSRPI
jgi:hypothetical protein